jgi:hypothetical protein
MSNRSPDDLTCSGVKERYPIGMDYRANHAEHKFPSAPSASFDCQSTSLAFCSSTGGKWGERIRHDDDVSGVSAGTLSKDFFAALLERVTATIFHAFEQRLHKLKPFHPSAQLRDFSLRELVPAFRWTRPRRESEEELAYFLQSESCLSGALHHGQTEERTLIVAALTILTHCRGENPDLLVVANSGSAQTKHARDIGNRQVPCHRGI